MAEFQYNLAMLEQSGISVYALSTDPEDKARETVERGRLAFPVLYGMDGPALAAAWGAYYEERRNILHATSFILRPDHTIASVTYSTGPVGRLQPAEVGAVVNFYRRQAAAK